jgi:serine/tyrosine/threonine adenylyltransferase
VINTDNTSIAGETIDYGPCAFLDRYDPAAVFSAIDQWGRYAYGNQPAIGEWNLVRFAECLLPLLAADTDAAVAEAQDALGGFAERLDAAYSAGMRRKLGLLTRQDGDDELRDQLLRAMAEQRADFTLTFRRLADITAGSGDDEGVRCLFDDPAAFDAWASRWRQRLEAEPGTPAERGTMMRQASPAFIPRNHRIEAVISAAVEDDDFGPFHELVDVLARPYEDQPEFARYQEPPREHERVTRTFCGT